MNKSTISRELKRNRTKTRGYRPVAAHQQARARRIGKVKPRLSRKDWKLVERLLQERWSPEQISGRLAYQGSLSISHEWIYQYVKEDKFCGGELYHYLRCQRVRRKRYGRQDRRGHIPGRVSIEQRPAIVEDRQSLGDWELDTVYGKGNEATMLTAVERKSRYVCIDILPNRTAPVVSKSLIRILSPVRDKVLTLTSDNGSEFYDHQVVAKSLGADYYFAHPHASWERGTNENTNGLIRQYFTRKHDFAAITVSGLKRVADQLNNRPRRCLGMNPPNEVFFGIAPEVALHG